jgi:hypothetical protein
MAHSQETGEERHAASFMSEQICDFSVFSKCSRGTGFEMFADQHFGTDVQTSQVRRREIFSRALNSHDSFHCNAHPSNLRFDLYRRRDKSNVTKPRPFSTAAYSQKATRDQPH